MAINPQFSEETESAILERMLETIDDDVDKRQGSIAYDLTDPVAQELAQAYINLDLALSYAFLNEDMPEDLLTLAASDFGVDRKPSVQASGQVTFSGAQGLVIPRGTQVRTDSGVYFETLEDARIISESITLTVRALEGGVDGNVDAGEIDTVTGDLAGVLSVTNVLAFENGVDEESAEALLERVYEKMRKPATSGNVYHYEQWAKSVAGVGDARVYPIWDGPGTVKVVVLSDDKRTPTQSVIDAVSTYIESERPIGAEVTIVGAHEIPVTVSADLTLATDGTLDEVRADIERGVTAYLRDLAFNDTLLRYTRIAQIILDVPRVVDYENLTVNGGTSNIEVTGDDVAVLEAVVLNDE